VIRIASEEDQEQQKNFSGRDPRRSLMLLEGSEGVPRGSVAAQADGTSAYSSEKCKA